MPGMTQLFKAGCFDADNINAINTSLSNVPNQLATVSLTGQLATGFGSAITLLPAGFTAGTYRVTVGAVVTTTITTATSWLFTIAYTDDQGARTPTVSTSSTMTAGTSQSGSYLFKTTGATALTYTPTAASAGAGVVAYTVVVERII